MSKVAVLGPEGTFTDAAAKRMFPGARLEYMEDVGDVFRFVSEGKGLGVAAVENSLEGSVGKTMESLMRYDLKITGELTLDISLCLLAKKGVKAADVKAVMSHPHALAQCRDYLDRKFPKAKRQGTSSTTEAMKEAAGRGDAAAVGSKESGLKYGLAALDEGIQDQGSQTRFISISREEAGKAGGLSGKTSLIFAVNDEPGALYSILKVFSDAKINLTKIESRPSRRRLGEYVFYLDYENQGMAKAKREALHAKVRESAALLKDLGSY
jgi:prephenate dehydratase